MIQKPVSLGVLLALTLLGISSGCAGAGKSAPSADPAGPRPSETLAPSIFYDEGKLVFVGVNAALARFSLDEPLIPLEIAVANKGLTKLTVGPEMITLRDKKGGAWPVAAPEESVGKSSRSSWDRNLMPVPFPDIIRLRFSSFTQVPATYGFRPVDYTMSRTAEMAKNTWLLAQIWFPNPGGDLKGKVFDVQIDSPELPDPVFVTIRF